MLAASLLTDEPVRLSQLPLIEDVRTMLRILDDLGVQVDLDEDAHEVVLTAGTLRTSELNRALCDRVRSSILFAGPLVARLGRATLYPPGGDVIGRRRLDTHFEGLRALGVTIEGERTYHFSCPRLQGTRILLDEASVTATENLVMAAVLARGRTTLFNTACEPHVQDLCEMLLKMGAQIEGVGTNRLIIEGVESLSGVEHRISSDSIEAASYVAAAAMTGGELLVENVNPGDFEVLARSFRKLGVRWTLYQNTLFLPASQTLHVQDDVGNAIPKIEDGIWPGFPSDLMSVMIVMATQAQGTMLFFEKLFESRMFFVDHVIGMGARIVQCDPHRVVVSGPAQLHGTRMNSPDIRAGMALLLAALKARGESVILNAESIDRGYERVEQELRALGAKIQRVE